MWSQPLRVGQPSQLSERIEDPERCQRSALGITALIQQLTSRAPAQGKREPCTSADRWHRSGARSDERRMVLDPLQNAGNDPTPRTPDGSLLLWDGAIES